MIQGAPESVTIGTKSAGPSRALVAPGGRRRDRGPRPWRLEVETTLNFGPTTQRKLLSPGSAVPRSRRVLSPRLGSFPSFSRAIALAVHRTSATPASGPVPASQHRCLHFPAANRRAPWRRGPRSFSRLVGRVPGRRAVLEVSSIFLRPRPPPTTCAALPPAGVPSSASRRARLPPGLACVVGPGNACLAPSLVLACRPYPTGPGFACGGAGALRLLGSRQVAERAQAWLWLPSMKSAGLALR